jgi:glutathione S-transferase
MIRIHNFPGGARGVRAIWVCEEMGLAYETSAVSFPPSDAYKALNPLGSVPFLEDGDVAINESIAIMFYLAERYGPTPLLPRNDPVAMARVMQLTVFGEASIGAGIDPLLMAKFGAPDADKLNWSVRTQVGRIERFIAFIEAQLGDRPFLVGDSLTLADIAVTTAFGIWQGALDGPLSERLQAWRASLAERSAYQRAQAAQKRTPG